MKMAFLRVKALLTQRDLDYKSYWESRYKGGGDSGWGSYGESEKFKAEFLNRLIDRHNIQSVIDFGCGDGNQLIKINFKKYLGLDVSSSAINICRGRFSDDKSKSFLLYNPTAFLNNGFLTADAVICLDVLYHIVDENEFGKTLNDIFSCGARYIILYSTLLAEHYKHGYHARHLNLLERIKNYPNYSIDVIQEGNPPTPLKVSFVVLKKTHD